MCIYFSVQRYQNQEITLQSQKWYATEKKKSFKVMTVFFKKKQTAKHIVFYYVSSQRIF